MEALDLSTHKINREISALRKELKCAREKYNLAKERVKALTEENNNFRHLKEVEAQKLKETIKISRSNKEEKEDIRHKQVRKSRQELEVVFRQKEDPSKSSKREHEVAKISKVISFTGSGGLPNYLL
jgi:alanyl-tRNA synthetase